VPRATTDGEVNGEPVAASSRLLNGLLRGRLNFSGLLVTDWAEIENLHSFHRVAATPSDAVELAMRHTSSAHTLTMDSHSNPSP
jgi:beta-glucosidase